MRSVLFSLFAPLWLVTACVDDPAAAQRLHLGASGPGTNPASAQNANKGLGDQPAKSVVSYEPAVVINRYVRSTGSVHVEEADGCSGTLLSPRVVLTAGHCVVAGAEGTTIEWHVRSLATGVSADAEAAYTSYESTGKHINPNALDVGILVLPASSPLELNSYPQVARHELQSEQSVAFLGRRDGEHNIRPDDATFFRSPFLRAIAVSNAPYAYVTTPQVTGPGDSGGPVVDEKSGMIVGVVSGGADLEDGTPASVAAKVNLAHDWIQEKIRSVDGS